MSGLLSELKVRAERTELMHKELKIRLSANLARIDQITGQHNTEGTVVIGPCSEYMRDELLSRMRSDMRKCKIMLEEDLL